jgi:uncharacterized protein YdhG (YjbR/CyaY superfamily)
VIVLIGGSNLPVLALVAFAVRCRVLSAMVQYRAVGEQTIAGSRRTHERRPMSTPEKKAAPKFTKEERAAMRERARELKAEAQRVDGEKALLAKVGEMKGSDRVLAEKLHEIVKANAPDLSPKTWYGMPAYANKDGKVVCFFQDAAKFDSRYATFGFNDAANLDDGAMWATTFALRELTAADEKKIAALVKKAVS